LLQAKGRAEAADRVKSSFLASMSHELRTPLNSIIGFTGVLLQDLAGPLNPEQAKQLGMVSHSAQHLLALINDVLDISKIEAGQLKVHPERFQLAKSVEKAVESVRPLAHKKNLDLRMELQPIPEPMYSDPRRVEQILLNLLNNAVKFTPQGGISIMLDLSPAPPGVGMPAGTSLARIRVTDTGIGISPEDQRYLFQPFRQVMSELSRRHEGTGLGLAICRRLAVLLGGDITVESETGRGSTFTLLLPLRRGTES
jgi:signal transduction histidine kinase